MFSADLDKLDLHGRMPVLDKLAPIQENTGRSCSKICDKLKYVHAECVLCYINTLQSKREKEFDKTAR